MSRNKVVVMILLFFAGLHLLSLAIGLHYNIESEGQPSRDEIKNSWVSYLQNPLLCFTPNLLRCNDQPVDEIFSLTEHKNQCEIEIPGSKKGIVLAKLNILQQGVEVYVRSNSSKLPSNCMSNSQFKPGLILKYDYSHEGNSRAEQDCWIVQDNKESIIQVVLRDGGNLILTCDGCSKDSEKQIQLILEEGG